MHGLSQGGKGSIGVHRASIVIVATDPCNHEWNHGKGDGPGDHLLIIKRWCTLHKRIRTPAVGPVCVQICFEQVLQKWEYRKNVTTSAAFALLKFSCMLSPFPLACCRSFLYGPLKKQLSCATQSLPTSALSKKPIAYDGEAHQVQLIRLVIDTQ